MKVLEDNGQETPIPDSLARIVRWLLVEPAPVIEQEGVNWKVIIHGGPKDLKTVLERYQTL